MTKPPVESVETECTRDVKSLRRRSNSLIPIITIDHFGSADFLNLLSKPVLPETSLPNPTNMDGVAVDLLTMNRPRIRRRCSSPLIRPRAASPLSAHGSLPVPSRKESNSSPSVADLDQESLYQIGCHNTSIRTDAACYSIHDEV